MTKIYDCNLEILSPTHIGSGSKYSSLEYVKDKKTIGEKKYNVIKRINLKNYYASLTENKQDELLNFLSNVNSNLELFDDKIPNKFMEYYSYNVGINKYNPIISECVKTLNESYVPGSSIKGAIETAILYNSLKLNKIPDIIRNYRAIFNNKFSSIECNNPSQCSIFKFLQISDSKGIKSPTIYEVNILMADKEKNENKNKFKLNKNNKIQKLYLETIAKNNNLSFELKDTFNKDIHSKLKLNTKLEQISVSNIKSSLYDFSNAYIDHEISFAEKYGMDNLLNFYKDLKKNNKVSEPYIRLGGGVGLLETTIGLKVLEYDEKKNTNLMENIRHLNYNNSYNFCFPKSRKIIAYDNKPLGWAKVSFKWRKNDE